MELLGHKEKILDLEKEILGAPGGQSFLFSGPEGIGKFTAALELAKRLVNEPDFIATEALPTPTDVLVLAPRAVTKNEKTKQQGIPLEEIREATRFLSRYPAKGRFRILIIRDAEALSPAAQNMLLKTLEEPAESALLILTAREPGALLPTVLSRTLEKVFLLVPEEEMAQKYPDSLLQKNNLPVFFRHLGRPGILEDALRNPEGFQKEKELLSKLYTITRLGVKDRLLLAEELSLDVPSAARLLEWWVTGLRNQARELKKQESVRALYGFIDGILEVRAALKNTGVNVKLLFEQLFFQIR